MVRSERTRGAWFHILDILFNIVVIVAIVTGIRTFLISPFQVEGSSMTSTLEDNQYIVINKLAYYIGHPQRGDIVVFRPPNEQKKYYVKRVIGLPGDAITLRDGSVFLRKAGTSQEKELPEPYLDAHNNGKTYRHPPGSGNREETQFTIPEGRYFLMGDNRQGSLDSRSFALSDGEPAPYVAEDAIKGKVWFVALPIGKIHALEPPDYEW